VVEWGGKPTYDENKKKKTVNPACGEEGRKLEKKSGVEEGRELTGKIIPFVRKAGNHHAHLMIARNFQIQGLTEKKEKRVVHPSKQRGGKRRRWDERDGRSNVDEEKKSLGYQVALLVVVQKKLGRGRVVQKQGKHTPLQNQGGGEGWNASIIESGQTCGNRLTGLKGGGKPK